jgi:large subunit ribosomal protein L4
VDDLNLEGGKTKFAAKFIKGLKLSGKILMLVDGKNERFIRAARNLKGVRILSIPEINIHDLLNTDNVVIEKETYGMLEEALR